MIKDQGIFSLVIILLILITLSLDIVLMLLGENWCCSLLAPKGLTHSLLRGVYEYNYIACIIGGLWAKRGKGDISPEALVFLFPSSRALHSSHALHEMLRLPHLAHIAPVIQASNYIPKLAPFRVKSWLLACACRNSLSCYVGSVWLFLQLIYNLFLLSDKWCSRQFVALGVLCDANHLGIVFCSELSPWCSQWVRTLSCLVKSFYILVRLFFV